MTMLVDMILTKEEVDSLDDLTPENHKVVFMSVTPGSSITDPNDPEQRKLVLAEMRKGLQQILDGTATPVTNIDGDDFVRTELEDFTK